MKTALFLGCLVCASIQAQVTDVNGDDIVGAEEALVVAEQWKGIASASNDHTHLGQTWEGTGRALTIKGEFPNRLIFGKETPKGILVHSAPSGALNLENTGFADPDLCLDGDLGILSVTEYPDSSLLLKSNNDVTIYLNEDHSGGESSFFIRRALASVLLFYVSDEQFVKVYGDLEVSGGLTYGKSEYRIDHPIEPESKYLVHSNVGSFEDLNVYSGTTLISEGGEVWVDLPSYVEALNTDFRYQLTCVGGYAPVYVAEEISENRFKIGGGHPGLKVCWEVTGVRNDPFAKAHPTEVETEKKPEEKGRYLQPSVYGQPVEMGIGYDVAKQGE